MRLQLWQESNSQCGQESLVLSLLSEKNNGHYLEIGAWDFKESSNTYLLETKYNWTGIAVEISKKYAKKYNKKRKNQCINDDALKLDYAEILKANEFPKVIDYLQLDIDPAINTFNCLLRIPFEEYQFRVITFEHDLYVDSRNSIYQKIGKQHLESFGYIRIAKNVSYNGLAFEDWYINPNLINEELVKELKPDSNWENHFNGTI